MCKIFCNFAVDFYDFVYYDCQNDRKIGNIEKAGYAGCIHLHDRSGGCEGL